MLRARSTEQQFLLDGELIIPIGDVLSFDALQLRLHPAESRVRKLAAETPARADGVRPARTRRQVADVAAACPSAARRSSNSVARTASPASCCRPMTGERDVALDWLERSGGALDGVDRQARTSSTAPASAR